MITPQEAETHVFSKASFGGYNMAQVDKFLDALIADYSTLYRENAELKEQARNLPGDSSIHSPLEVENAALKGQVQTLTEQVAEYRSAEDAIRRTLLNAQRTAELIIQEAEDRKTSALREALAEVELRSREINQEIANEEMRLAAARSSTTAYVNKLKELYTHELDYIGHLSDLSAPPPQQERPLLSAAQEIEDSVCKLLEEDGSEVAQPDLQETLAETVEEAISEAPEVLEAELHRDVDELSDTIQFNQLQFGKDYEIK